MKRITEYDAITTVAEADVVPIVDVSDTEQASTGSTRKGTIETIADYLKARTETQTNKTLTSPVLNTADINTPDIDGGTIDDTTINGGSIESGTDVTEVLKKVYPVGCIYTSTVSTNPNTLFGFGTWTAFGAGKTLVGIDSGDADFDTAEETGGAKTHTLTEAEMPSHTHSLTRTLGGTQSFDIVGSTICIPKLDTDGNLTTDTIGTSSAGSGDAHSIVQPYIVTYFWKRTA